MKKKKDPIFTSNSQRFILTAIIAIVFGLIGGVIGSNMGMLQSPTGMHYGEIPDITFFPDPNPDTSTKQCVCPEGKHIDNRLTGGSWSTINSINENGVRPEYSSRFWHSSDECGENYMNGNKLDFICIFTYSTEKGTYTFNDKESKNCDNQKREELLTSCKKRGEDIKKAADCIKNDRKDDPTCKDVIDKFNELLKQCDCQSLGGPDCEPDKPPCTLMVGDYDIKDIMSSGTLEYFLSYGFSESNKMIPYYGGSAYRYSSGSGLKLVGRGGDGITCSGKCKLCTNEEGDSNGECQGSGDVVPVG